MDGGTIQDLNIESAVNACQDMGYAEKDIIVDILICGYMSLPSEAKTGNAINNLVQARDIHGAFNDGNAVLVQERAYPDVKYRYYQLEDPAFACDVTDLLDFNNSTTWCLQEAGRQQAKDALAKRSLEEMA